MDDLAAESQPSTPVLWSGRGLSAIVVLFMLFDGIIKLVPLDIVLQTNAELGWPVSVGLMRALGIIGLLATILYAVPRTSMLGAILLTGYFGGAVATHLRIGSPLFSHTLFGLYLGILAWGGLYLRDRRIRALIPLAR
jgi:hypothetical protein